MTMSARICCPGHGHRYRRGHRTQDFIVTVGQRQRRPGCRPPSPIRPHGRCGLQLHGSAQQLYRCRCRRQPEPLRDPGRWQPLPAWLSFNAATQTFSGTPLNERCRLAHHPRHRNRHFAGATATQDFTVTVNNTNDAPVITSLNAASFAENATGTVYTAAATDPGCRNNSHLFDYWCRRCPVQHQCHNGRCFLQVVTELRSANRCWRQQCL